jgi:hypothetical protein
MSKPKLFIFGIGGTGSRVIKALTMLLAAGIDANASEIIPIIIDPHLGNEDFRRTTSLLGDYQAIQNKLGEGRTEGFFKTRIRTLKELATDGNLQNSFAFNLQNVQNETFRSYVDFTGLEGSNRDLAELLFSKSNLDTEMDIGFIGNPNIGAVVLNQFKDSEEFKLFASRFAQNDRIFIISSIFGGTGAAGFPLILKNIRNAASPLQNPEYLRNARVGAVTVLPYFGLAPGESSIDMATFISKTKAALSYYEMNVTGNKSLNALYYIGDDIKSSYQNDPGQGGQRNDAHLVELAAAMSVIDFMKMDDEALQTENGKAVNPKHREFGIQDDIETLTFNTLGDKTQKLIKRPLTQYLYFSRYLRDELQNSINKNEPFVKETVPKIDNSFTTSFFFQTVLSNFNKAYEEWLTEMARNQRRFQPFNLSTKQIQEMLSEIKTKQRKFIGGERKIDYLSFNNELNRFYKNSFPSAEIKLFEVFYKSTNALLLDFYDSF